MSRFDGLTPDGDVKGAFDSVKVRIDGLEELLKDLKAVGDDMKDMRELMHEVGKPVAQKVKETAPRSNVRKGQAHIRNKARSGRRRHKAVIMVGGYSTPYAPIIEFGWPARNIAPQYFTGRALEARYSESYRILETGIDEIIRKNGFK